MAYHEEQDHSAQQPEHQAANFVYNSAKLTQVLDDMRGGLEFAFEQDALKRPKHVQSLLSTLGGGGDYIVEGGKAYALEDFDRLAVALTIRDAGIAWTWQQTPWAADEEYDEAPNEAEKRMKFIKRFEGRIAQAVAEDGVHYEDGTPVSMEDVLLEYSDLCLKQIPYEKANSVQRDYPDADDDYSRGF